MLWFDRLSRCGRCRVVVGMSGEAGSFLTMILGPRDGRGERLASALNWVPSLEEVGEALSKGSLEARELGVTAWGECVEGAMGAYVLDEPTPSADRGAACWAGTGGVATAVDMVAVRCVGRGFERLIVGAWQGLV